MQKLLTTLIAIGIIYTIAQYNYSAFSKKYQEEYKNDKTENQNNQVEISNEVDKNTNEPFDPTGNFVEKTLSKVAYNILQTRDGRIFFEKMMEPIGSPMPNLILNQSNESIKFDNTEFINRIFRIKTFDEGTEGPVSCGHTVTVKYKLLTMDNVLIEEGEETFSLGSKKISTIIDPIIVGMKIGQTRHAIINAKTFTNSNFKNYEGNVKVNVVLIDAMPKKFIDKEVKIFDDSLSFVKPFVCSDFVNFDVKITDLKSNNIIFDSKESKKKISMTIGSMNYPIIFSHALHGKMKDGTRTVITKGKFLESFITDISAIFPNKEFEKEDYFLIDFTNAS